MSEIAAEDSRFSLELFTPELTALLRRCARQRHLQKHEVIYAYGSSPDALFCVERGRVCLSVASANGRESVLSIAIPGQWFGETSLLAEKSRVHDARAMEDSEILVVPSTAFHEIMEQHPAYLMEFTRLVSRRYRSALRHLDALVLLPFPERLARRLLNELHTQTAPTTESPTLHVSQENLAYMLGVSRQSVNRQLKDWEAQGILKLRYGRILLIDQEALQRLA